ncbi:MAG: SDR family NAD(P)-dependent oxidoreductase, partial [Acidobacteriota bacterium]
MEERLGLIVTSIEELEDQLAGILEGKENIEKIYRGRIKSNKEALAILASDEDMLKLIDVWMNKRKVTQLLELWIKGVPLDWNKLYSEIKPSKISLPTYPFARKHYWLPENNKKISISIPTTSTREAMLHPLLHRNTSDLSAQRFSSIFSGQEFFLADHQVQGEKILPAVAYLEMARAAVQEAAGCLEEYQCAGTSSIVKLKNVVWIRPIVVNGEGEQVHIRLEAQENGQIHYQIYTHNNTTEPIIHSQGMAVFDSCENVPTVDLLGLQSQINERRLSAEQCYQTFKTMGIEYGYGHQGLEVVYVGKQQVLAKITLPATVMDTAGQYVLHPALLDSALQASIGLAMEANEGVESLNLSLPFALDELTIFERCNSSMWVWIQPIEGSVAEDRVEKYDIYLCNDSGTVCVKMTGCSARVVEKRIVPMEHALPNQRIDVLHPLVHKNCSTLTSLQFTSTFKGREFFLADHVIEGVKVLPGAAHLEMTLAAVSFASQKEVLALKDIIWAQPIRVYDKAANVSIHLVPQSDHIYQANILSGMQKEGDATVHFQGKLILRSTQEKTCPGSLPIQTIQSRCKAYKDAKEILLWMQETLNSSYIGKSFQVIEALQYNDQEALLTLKMPTCVDSGSEAYTLHPSIISGALGGVEFWSIFQSQETIGRLPFTLQELWIYGRLPKFGYAYIRLSSELETRSNVKKYDIDITDIQGEIAVSFKGFTTIASQRTDKQTIVYATQEWQIRALSENSKSLPIANPIFILAENNPKLQEALSRQWSGATIETLSSLGLDLTQGIQENFLQVFKRIQTCIKAQPKSIQPFFILISEKEENYLHGALVGLLKTARLENAQVFGKILYYATSEIEDIQTLLPFLQAEIRNINEDMEVRFTRSGAREVKRWKQINLSPSDKSNLKLQKGDVVWITGGAGGLGQIFARYLGIIKGVKLILTGRAPLDITRRKILAELQQEGAEVDYLQSDIGNKKEVQTLVQTILKKYGKLNGILHTAGVLHDSYIITKSVEEVRRVLMPKVTGILAIEEATRNIPLDFMVLFSSISALGKPGQADYAGANSFLDTFAAYRNQQVKQGKCFGKTVSLNWPLWREGRMKMDRHNEILMEQSTGLASMDTENGLYIFDQALCSSYGQVLVAPGDAKKICTKLLQLESYPIIEARQREQKVTIVSANNKQKDFLIRAIHEELIQSVSHIQKINYESIDLKTELQNYGFDSISFTEFANRLNQIYELELMPTIFFEHLDLLSLGNYLVENYQEILLKKYLHSPNQVAVFEDLAIKAEKIENKTDKRRIKHRRFVSSKKIQAHLPYDSLEPIAIIGINGRFPGSTSLEDFWKHLESNQDLITEIPADRWDWRKIYGDPNKESGKTKVKYGGFIADVDRFDSMFFGISPREAESMDPQFRLLLETIWATIEDAGYRASALSGRKTGVFVGVTTADYKDLWQQANIEDGLQLGLSHFMIANRISYLLNLHGPSEAIDTACSSSLVAVHRAIESIRSGSCETALVGGVNVIANPGITIAASQAGMLSEDGRCKTFDKRADGYGRGEGVGAIFLKPLVQAIEDADHIYGLILGSAENHSGRSSSPTAPNPVAQENLLVSAYTKAGVDVSTVSYIETHGTGTQLGDPIEVNGLKGAFAELYRRQGVTMPANPHCGLGSVKTNIGHLEAAAGISGIIKILLMMRYKKIPGNVHLQEQNPYLQLAGSQFYLVKETQEWKPILDENGDPIPRRAGVSSFGVGGSNAHIILEEYLEKVEKEQINMEKLEPYLILLSGKNEERLKEYAGKLVEFIQRENSVALGKTINLIDMAYTLQIGREAMGERLGLLVTSIQELLDKLQSFLSGQKQIEGFYRGQAKSNKEVLSLFAADEDLQEAIEKWIQRKKYSKLLELWVKGLSLDWNKLYGENRPSRISLPTYPFAREHYWLPENDKKISISIPTTSTREAMLHPLLHRNTSDLSAQRFSSIFSGQEFFLADHQVQGEKILPAVAYLEMARAAVQEATGCLEEYQCAGTSSIVKLKNVVWIRPIVVNGEGEQVHIRLEAQENGQIHYQIYTHNNTTEPIIHSQGMAVFDSCENVPTVDLLGLQSQINERRLSAEQCYQTFKTMGIEYGYGHQGLEVVYVGKQQVLAKITLPATVMDTEDQYVLHPALLDSALQASIGLAMEANDRVESLSLSLPFALDELTIFERCNSSMWVWIRPIEGSVAEDRVEKYDIYLCNDSGTVCVSIKGFSIRVLVGEIAAAAQSRVNNEPSKESQVGLKTLTPVWNSISLTEQRSLFPNRTDKVVIVGGTHEQRNAIKTVYP